MSSCAAPTGGAAAAIAAADLTKEAVIKGVVRRDRTPAAGAYVRLLDRTGEFTAEVPTGDDGTFAFFAGPGDWTIRALATGNASAEGDVTAARGVVAELELDLA